MTSRKNPDDAIDDLFSRFGEGRASKNELVAELAKRFPKPAVPGNVTALFPHGSDPDATIPPTRPTPPAPAPSDPPADRPRRVFLAADGKPFRDLDAARYKADALAEQLQTEFEVRAGHGGFIVVAVDRPVPIDGGATPAAVEEPAPRHRSTAAQILAAADRAESVDLDTLTLADFPANHPVHRHGLAAFKKLLNNGYRLRPAYRSRAHLLLFAAVCAVIALVPGIVLGGLAPEAAEGLATDPAVAATRVTALFGLLALGAVGKVLYDRLFYRCQLLRDCAKAEWGIVSRSSSKLNYVNIQTTDTIQTVWGRILNYGTVELSCASNDQLLIRDVVAPELVRAAIDFRKQAARL
jgi:hypothetical protein